MNEKHVSERVAASLLIGSAADANSLASISRRAGGDPDYGGRLKKVCDGTDINCLREQGLKVHEAVQNVLGKGKVPVKGTKPPAKAPAKEASWSSRRTAVTIHKTEKAKKKYLSEHPAADASNHKVKSEGGGGSKAKPDSGGSKAPAKSDGPTKPHGKKSVSQKAVKKVTNILKSNGVSSDSDELKELAGFKSGLGQRVPEKDVGKWYVRNVQTLKADFLKNMSPSSYKDPAAFKAAKERMKKMPAGDFAKILAAMTDEEV